LISWEKHYKIPSKVKILSDRCENKILYKRTCLSDWFRHLLIHRRRWVRVHWVHSLYVVDINMWPTIGENLFGWVSARPCWLTPVAVCTKSWRTDPVHGDLMESVLAAVEIDRTSTRRSGALVYGPCVRVCSSQWYGESGGSVGDRGQYEVKNLMGCVQRSCVSVF